jgi:hypothetical protein
MNLIKDSLNNSVRKVIEQVKNSNDQIEFRIGFCGERAQQHIFTPENQNKIERLVDEEFIHLSRITSQQRKDFFTLEVIAWINGIGYRAVQGVNI